MTKTFKNSNNMTLFFSRPSRDPRLISRQLKMVGKIGGDVYNEGAPGYEGNVYQDPGHMDTQGEGAMDGAELGYGTLCRYFKSKLRETEDNYTASNVRSSNLLHRWILYHSHSQVSTLMVDCWKKNRFEYPELEEMFLINMVHHDNNPELLARELGSTLRNSRLYNVLHTGA